MTTSNQAINIKTFCKNFGISTSMFYKLRRQGKAPKSMLIGKRRLITTEAITEWQKQMEDVSS